MNTLRFTAPIIATVLTCAFATQTEAQAESPPFDPVGSYTFTAFVEGSPIPGSMTISQSDDVYTGNIISDAGPPVPITAVVVDGNQGVIHGTGPTGPVIIVFSATEDGFAGAWTMVDVGGDFVATRVEPD